MISDDGGRFKPAMTNNNLPPPCLRLCIKDHKAIQPGQTLPCRPICGASESPNGQASHLVSLIINEVARLYDDGSECVSTEGMIAAMEQLNTRDDITELIIGSMDVKALYPSLQAIPTTNSVTEVFTEVDMKVEGVDWAEAGKYLALNLSQREISDLKIGHLVSTRKSKGGRHPGITTAEVLGKLYREEGEEAPTLFHPPRCRPNQLEEKIVLSQVIKISTLAILSMHSYQWNKDVKLQEEGAPIRLEIAGALARIVMLWWDKQFMKLLADNNILIHLYKRYIDDQNMAGKPLQPGTKWKEGPWASGLGKMVMMEEKVEEDSLVPAAVRTMTELRKMADTIHPMIQLEEDHQFNHHDRKLPILDIKVWVIELEADDEDEEQKRSKLRWQYYRKPMSNWLLIPANSAMAMSIKRTSLTQYGLRILRNTSLELSWDLKAEMLSEFSERMRDSGYREKFRYETMQSILKGWDKMVAEQERGGRPINRPRNFEEKKRREEKWRKKANWFKTGGYTTVLFCPWTPNGELARRWKEVEERGAATRGWRYKVIEQSGRPISSILCTNPWAGPCEAEDCFVCRTGGRGPCGRPGCTYAIQCITCRDEGPSTVPRDEENEGERRPGQGVVGQPADTKYHGESGYGGYTRGGEHQTGLQKKNRSNALWRHCELYHGGETAEFSMSVVSTTTKPFIRKIREGVEIVAGNQDILMNSKEEFLQGAVPSTRVQRGFGR